jgi:hypothetical protein
VQAEIASSDIIARAICRRIDIDGRLQLAANGCLSTAFHVTARFWPDFSQPRFTG